MADAYKDTGCTPLEALSRLSIRTTYRTPSTPRAETPNPDDVSQLDRAAALGYVKDELIQCLALALACQTVTEWPRIQRLAAPRILARLLANHRTRPIVTGTKRYRARLVLHDVFFDLVANRRPAYERGAAQIVRMAEREYRLLYREVAAAMDTWAREGAHEARQRLGAR